MADVKSRLQQICEDAGIPVRSYSGRGMYGQTCLGIEPEGGVGELFSAVLEAVEGEDDTFELRDAFINLRTDSMGLGIIVYFPGMPFVKESACEECGEACDDDLAVCEDCAEMEVRP